MKGNKGNKSKGFTLVELLVVITIISIITMITVGQFMTARRKAADGQRKGDINALSKALQMYYADYGKFPPASVNGKLTNGSGTEIEWGEEFKDVSNYVYMKVLPREKSDSLPDYCYVTDTNGSMYGIFAMMENTTDNQCIVTGGVGTYSHCGGNRYCYSYVSPNIIVTDLDSYIP